MSWTKERALERHCRACDMMYYCSAACEAASTAREHGRLCPFVRRLMVHKADDHTKSLMLLVLLTLHEHALELAGIGGAARTYPTAPADQADASAAPATGTASDAAAGAAAAEDAQASAPAEAKEPAVVLTPSYADVETLQTHLQDWTQEDLDDWRYVLAAAVGLAWVAPALMRPWSLYACIQSPSASQQERSLPGAADRGRGLAVCRVVGAAVPVGA